MIVRDQKEVDWTVKHTLTEQELRQLILEKIERARLLQLANENRKLAEFAQCEDTGNEVLGAHYKHASNGRTSGWHSLLWEENTSY